MARRVPRMEARAHYLQGPQSALVLDLHEFQGS